MRSYSLGLAIFVSAVVAAALWFVCDRPVPIDVSWNQPLRSVSFAPFRRGESPLTKTYPTPQQIEEDLRSLVGLARGVRTYSALEGMQVVPDLAAKYGMKVIFSAWLGVKLDTNEAEVEALIQAANDHPNEIERVLVGNEVLLRRDLTPEQLISYIRRVKAAVKQPVSYADVWAFYLKHPEVVRELDYLTIHILPFWEDEPVAIDQVEDHIVKIVERVRQAYPGKPILIGEAGWPSIGRNRGPAVVSTVNEATFVRAMANVAAKYNFDYNIVEAFDQPWKAAMENTVGAAWGLLDVDRRPKFPLTGPVTEVPDWPLRAAVAIGMGALATLAFGLRISGIRACFAFAFMAQLLSWLAVTTVFHAQAVAFLWWQDFWAVFRGALGVVMGLAILDRAALFLAKPEAATGSAELSAFGRPLIRTGEWWRGEGLTLFTGCYAFIWTVLLAVDGRYRDIPVIDFSAPTAGLVLLIAIRVIQARRRGAALLPALALDGLFGQRPVGGRWARLSPWLARALVFASAAALVSEGLAIIGEDFTKDHPTLDEQLPLIFKAMISNREMILWAVMQLLLAVPFVASLWQKRRQPAADGLPKAQPRPAE